MVDNHPKPLTLRRSNDGAKSTHSHESPWFQQTALMHPASRSSDSNKQGLVCSTDKKAGTRSTSFLIYHLPFVLLSTRNSHHKQLEFISINSTINQQLLYQSKQKLKSFTQRNQRCLSCGPKVGAASTPVSSFSDLPSSKQIH